MSELPGRDEIVSAVRDALVREHGPDLAVDAHKFLRGGLANVLLKVGLSGSDLPRDWPAAAVVRLQPKPDLHPKAQRERTVLEFCRANGFPASQPLADGMVRDFSYLLVGFVEGREATSQVVLPWRRDRAVDDLACLHLRLHGLPVPSALEVKDADRWIADIQSAVAGRPALALDDAIAWLKAHRAMGSFDVPRLCHNDFSPANVLLSSDGTPTVIDWDMASLGDPICDLAFAVEKLHLIQGAVPRPVSDVLRLLLEPARARYLEAYSAAAEVPRDRLGYWSALYCVLIKVWSAGLYVGDIGVRHGARTGRLPSFAAKRFRELTA